MKFRVALFLFVSLTTNKIFSQTDSIDGYIQYQMQIHNISGLAIAVTENGKMIYKKTYGFANLETETPVSTQSVFELGTVTRPLTAIAIMMLAEEGRISLDDTITTFLDNNYIREDWTDITIRHLLNGTVCLPGRIHVEFDDIQDEHDSYKYMRGLDYTKSMVMNALSGVRLFAKPGEYACPSTYASFLLGLVIEKVTGMSYRKFMQERIFVPLHMHHTYIQNQLKVIKNRVSPYDIRYGKWIRARHDFQFELSSHCGIMSTVEDMARFDSALSAGLLLKPSTLDLMWTPAKLNNGDDALILDIQHGLNWYLGDIRGHRIAEYGSPTGAYFLKLIDDNLTVIVLSNIESDDFAQRQKIIAHRVLSLLRPDFSAPDWNNPQKDSFPKITKIINTFISDCKDLKQSKVISNVYKQSILNKKSDSMLKELSEFTNLTYVTSVKPKNNKIRRMGDSISGIYYYNAQRNNRVYNMKFWLNEKNQISFFRVYYEY